MFNKKMGEQGEVEWELKNIVFAVLLLVLGVGMITLLYFGKGGAVLDSIKKMLRFGRIILGIFRI